MADETVVELDHEAAAERLLADLQQQSGAGSNSPTQAAAALLLTIRAAHLLALAKVQGVQGYPATVQALLNVPEPAVDPERDAAFDPGDSLTFVDLLDLLSQEQLPCLAPHLHRGWQDKTQSCRQARRLTTAAFGHELDGEGRRALLAAQAITNRVFVAPPPVVLDLRRVRKAVRDVLRLISHLAPAGGAGKILDLISQLRRQVG